MNSTMTAAIMAKTIQISVKSSFRSPMLASLAAGPARRRC
jgi:hypothetical protein